MSLLRQPQDGPCNITGGLLNSDSPVRDADLDSAGAMDIDGILSLSLRQIDTSPQDTAAGRHTTSSSYIFKKFTVVMWYLLFCTPPIMYLTLVSAIRQTNSSGVNIRENRAGNFVGVSQSSSIISAPCLAADVAVQTNNNTARKCFCSQIKLKEIRISTSYKLICNVSKYSDQPPSSLDGKNVSLSIHNYFVLILGTQKFVQAAVNNPGAPNAICNIAVAGVAAGVTGSSNIFTFIKLSIIDVQTKTIIVINVNTTPLIVFGAFLAFLRIC